MTRVRGSLDIARPVEQVFDVVADQRNEPLQPEDDRRTAIVVLEPADTEPVQLRSMTDQGIPS